MTTIHCLLKKMYNIYCKTEVYTTYILYCRSFVSSRLSHFWIKTEHIFTFKSYTVYVYIHISIPYAYISVVISVVCPQIYISREATQFNIRFGASTRDLLQYNMRGMQSFVNFFLRMCLSSGGYEKWSFNVFLILITVYSS